MKQVNIFKALSDENRLNIFTALLFKELCVCKIQEAFEMKQANVSKHMIKLKEANMVESRKEGQWVHYKVSSDFLINNLKLVEYLMHIGKNNEQVNKAINLDIKDRGGCNVRI